MSPAGVVNVYASANSGGGSQMHGSCSSGHGRITIVGPRRHVSWGKKPPLWDVEATVG